MFCFGIIKNKSLLTLTRPLSTEVLQKIELNQSGPFIQLSNRPFLAGSSGPEFPRNIDYASDSDCDCYQLQSSTTISELGVKIRNVLHNEDSSGALLVRGLNKVIEDNTSFGKLVDFIGEKFSYTAGFATRKEFDNAPGCKELKYFLKNYFLVRSCCCSR